MNHPDPLRHQILSFAKSGLRMLGCALALLERNRNPSLAIFYLAFGLLVAEIIGVVEELV